MDGELPKFIADIKNAQLDKRDKRIAELEAKVDKRDRFLERNGYRRCDIPACNCGFWHGGHAGERLRELSEELGEETQGTTILKAVKARGARIEQLENAIRDLDRHFASQGCGLNTKVRLMTNKALADD